MSQSGDRTDSVSPGHWADNLCTTKTCQSQTKMRLQETFSESKQLTDKNECRKAIQDEQAQFGESNALQ